MPNSSSELVLNENNSFAFFIHPTDDTDSLLGLRIAFPSFDEERLALILVWARTLSEYRINAEPVYHAESIRSKTGNKIEGWLIFSTYTAKEMIYMDRRTKERLLDSYLKAAKELSVGYIGLGAFTAILSKSGNYFKNCGIPVTTGNSYSAMCSIKAVEYLLSDKHESVISKSVAILGAYGSIGRIISLYACKTFRLVKLYGNIKNNNYKVLLEKLADEIIWECLDKKEIEDGVIASHVRNVFEQCPDNQTENYATYISLCDDQDEKPVIIISSITANVPIQADIVFCATSNAGKFLTLNEIIGTEVICDISRPTDLDKKTIKGSGIEYIEGGLSFVPNNVSFGIENLQGFDPGINLGCLSETIALSMEGEKINHSIGSQVSLDEVKHVYEICLKHGFKPYLKKYIE